MFAVRDPHPMSRASQIPNPYVGTTFIPDNTRMEVPPAWFLARIHDYDAELVLVPSRQRPFAYVLARRSRLGRKRLMEGAVEHGITQPDTLMCMQYGLVPVCMMFKHGPCWNADPIIETLKARDLWRVGGGDAAADLLDAQDAKEASDRREAKRQELWDLSGEAYRSYKQRTGQSVINAGPARTGNGAHRSLTLGP